MAGAAWVARRLGRTLVVAGTCGDLGAPFQRTYNLPSLPGAELAAIDGAGHITLFLEHADETVATIRAFLDRVVDRVVPCS